MFSNRIVSVLLVKIFSISDGAFLLRAKHQHFKKKIWISGLDLYLINFDYNDLKYPDL